MTILTANDLKMKGVSGIEKLLETEPEVIIIVRGKPRYVVMEIATYEAMRDRELEASWYQVREEMATGRYRVETAEDHMTRIEAEASDEL